MMLSHCQVTLIFFYLFYPKTFHILHDAVVHILVYSLQPSHSHALNPLYLYHTPQIVYHMLPILQQTLPSMQACPKSTPIRRYSLMNSYGEHMSSLLLEGLDDSYNMSLGERTIRTVGEI